MVQLLLILTLLFGGSTYWFYSENETLKINNVKLEQAVEQQKEAMEMMKESFETQAAALINLQQSNAAIEAEKDRYLDIFRRHNLDKLALMKPGLIETRINSGTVDVFEALENDSKNISNLSNNKPN
jgi:hypothetical protein